MENSYSLDKKLHIKVFSILYHVIACIIVIYTWSTGKIVIGGTDGINQHYRAMVYISNLYRQLISSLLKGEFVIPMFDYTIGMGDDILATLNYYGLGDPFYILTVFVSPRYMSYFYTFFFYFRLYMAGVAIILFLDRIIPGRKYESYIVAAFVYCFSGFALEANCHIIFVHAMMYLPLILWAIYGCFERKRFSRRILIICVAMLACTNIYFLYIISIIAVLFSLYLFVYRKDSRSAIFKVGLCYIGGCLCSATILAPIAMAVLESNRQKASSAHEYIRLVYSIQEYKELFYRLFYVTDSVRGMAAIPIIGFICVLIVLVRRNNRGLLFALLVGIACYCTPIVAWIMSGMGGNVYGRWEIVLTIIGSACVVDAWDDIITPHKSIIGVVWGSFFLFVLIGIFDNTLMERCYRNSLLGFLICCTVISILALCKEHRGYYSRIVVVIISIMCALFTWLTNVINYDISSIKDYSKIIDRIKTYDDEFYRIDFERAYNFSENIMNLSLVDNFSTTTEYFSIDNSGYVDGRYRMGLGDSYLITGFDNRSILQTLASVKYIIADKRDEYIPPYGFEINDELINDSLRIYKNRFAMPIAYSYRKEMSRDETSLEHYLEEQAAITEFVTKEYGNSQFIVDESQYIKEYGNAYEVRNVKTDRGTHYSITCICKKNMETYLELNNSFFEGNVIINGYTKKIWGKDVKTINLGYYNTDTKVNVQFDNNERINKQNIILRELDVVSMFRDELGTIQSVDNVLIEKNRVLSKIDFKEDQIFCLSIPFTKGWKAYLDGKMIDTFVVNDIFLGAYIPKGLHDVEFRYTTPGLRIGFIISLCSICGIYYLYKLERKKDYDEKYDSYA